MAPSGATAGFPARAIHGHRRVGSEDEIDGPREQPSSRGERGSREERHSLQDEEEPPTGLGDDASWRFTILNLDCPLYKVMLAALTALGFCALVTVDLMVFAVYREQQADIKVSSRPPDAPERLEQAAASNAPPPPTIP